MSHRYPEHIADKTANRIADRAPSLARHAELIRGLPAEVAYMEDIEISSRLAGVRPAESVGDILPLLAACARTGAPKPEEIAVWRMWSGSRAVYRFDDSLAEALADTDGTAGLSLGALEAMLPLESFFIEEPIEVETFGEIVPCVGFFALHVFPGAIQLSYVGRDATVARSDTVFTNLGDVGSAVESIMEVDRMTGSADLDGYDAALCRDTTRAALGRSLASVAYLETPDAEVVDAGRTPAPSKRHRGAGVGSTPSWTVGSAIGGRIRAHDAVRRAGAGASGSVRPHMRRAHWSHYWTGPRGGQRRLEPRWIHPVFVNGADGARPETTVVHPVHGVGR